MNTKYLLYIFLTLSLCGCRTTQWTLRGKEGQPPITLRPLSEIRAVDHLVISEPGKFTSWEEEGHTYMAVLGFLTRQIPSRKISILSGTETLRYKRGAWARYLNELLGRVGIRTEGIILSVPNHLVLFRSYEPLSRKRVIECLMSPRGYESRVRVSYAEAHIFTRENMAIRELYESPADNQILIVDHLRDRNGVGDLCVAYILQDTSGFSFCDRRRYSFLGDPILQRLMSSRTMTYQYIEQTLSPITVSLLPSCRYKEFVPRDSTEIIPTNFLHDDEPTDTSISLRELFEDHQSK